MSRILVTGSAGFIGTHLLPEINGHEVVGYDFGKRFVHGPFDGIIHLAAISGVAAGEKDHVECLQTNLVLTASLLREFNPAWIIFASTNEKPKNVYGLSKHFAEDYIRLHGTKHIIIRLSNVYGPGMREDKLLPRLKRGDAVELYDDALPFEYIHVDDVVAQIVRMIPTFENQAFKSYTLKMASGVANSEKQLRHVAASY